MSASLCMASHKLDLCLSSWSTRVLFHSWLWISPFPPAPNLSSPRCIPALFHRQTQVTSQDELLEDTVLHIIMSLSGTWVDNLCFHIPGQTHSRDASPGFLFLTNKKKSWRHMDFLGSTAATNYQCGCFNNWAGKQLSHYINTIAGFCPSYFHILSSALDISLSLADLVCIKRAKMRSLSKSILT